MARRVTKKVSSDEIEEPTESTSQPRGPISLRFYLGKLKKGEFGFDLLERDKVICVLYGMVIGLTMEESVRYVGGVVSEKDIWSERVQDYLRSKGVNIDGEQSLSKYCSSLGKAFFQGAQHSKTSVACDSNMLRHVGEHIYQQTKQGGNMADSVALIDYSRCYKCNQCGKSTAPDVAE